ncbi:hypothetical protein [Modestobacter marinus]|uniref:hypothetical protein n=1 Tax=Modestobacter marinus TaxID=477641 RepID=UPI001C962055|nr:hypothetical protein [Modestobacter marinus]
MTGDPRLREVLDEVARPAGHWRLSGEEAVADVLARTRRQRRRLAGGVVSALAVIAVAVPLARAVPEPVPPSPAATTDADRGPVPSVPVLVAPTRGSLAGDAAFLAAVRRVGWGAQDAPPPDEREVVLATDTPDGRVALVVGHVEDDFRGVWLTGPVGAAADQLSVHLPAGLGRERPLSLAVGGPGPATLVVVAGRGDRIEVSPRLAAGPRGTVSRSYAAADAVEGVAVVPVRTTQHGTAVSVRVLREDRVVYRAGVDWLDGGAGRRVDLPVLSPLRPGGTPPAPAVLSAALVGLAVPLGVEPAALDPELLWSGPLPAGGRPGTVAVVVAHSPGGALAVTTWAGGAGAPVACGTQTPPGNAEVGGLTVARVCALPSPAGGSDDDERWLVLTAPPSAVRAEVLDRHEQLLVTLPLDGGSTVVPMPEEAAEVRTLDASGQRLAATAIAPPALAPFGDYGSGPER